MLPAETKYILKM